MPFLNEGKEPQRTIDSIFNTSISKKIEIIAIDDSSDQVVEIKPHNNVRLIKTDKRIGVDACRQLGVEEAISDNILVIDAHMRFPNNWLEDILLFLNKNPKSICCTTCCALGYGNMNLSLSKDKYYGATIKLFDKNTDKDRPAREILEPKWIGKLDGSSYQIPCVLGANYFFKKDWFMYLQGWNGLTMWGSSEPFISIKSYLAGGDCKILTNVEIGHKFREKAPYVTRVDSLIYNKLYMMETLFPNELKEYLIDLMPKTKSLKRAKKMINKNDKEIKRAKKYYENNFNHDIYNYCNKFQIEIPLEIKDFT